MTTPPAASGSAATGRRWRLIRDLAVFVVKAGIEAIRDVVLIPVAAIAGVAGLILSPNAPERLFHEVLALGRRFDRWLDLFGPGARKPRRLRLGRRARGHSFDDTVQRVEKILTEQQERGGVTASAKDAIDRALDGLQRAVRRPSSQDGEDESHPKELR